MIRPLETLSLHAHEVCSPVARGHFIERAHRVAESLELGIAGQNDILPILIPRRFTAFGIHNHGAVRLFCFSSSSTRVASINVEWA